MPILFATTNELCALGPVDLQLTKKTDNVASAQILVSIPITLIVEKTVIYIGNLFFWGGYNTNKIQGSNIYEFAHLNYEKSTGWKFNPMVSCEEKQSSPEMSPLRVFSVVVVSA
jgi:hypothetical protein